MPIDRTYQMGDVIELDIEVQDVGSGVGQVTASFTGVNHGKTFILEANGGRQPVAKVTAAWTVNSLVPPDEYYLSTLLARDVVGNVLEVSSPELDLRLHIEAEDKEPPKLNT
jgi:hypothetical protein